MLEIVFRFLQNLNHLNKIFPSAQMWIYNCTKLSFFFRNAIYVTHTLFENMLNFTISQNHVFQGEIIFKFFLYSLWIKTSPSFCEYCKEKNGFICFVLCYNSWNPLPLSCGLKVKCIPKADLVQVILSSFQINNMTIAEIKVVSNYENNKEELFERLCN